MEKENVLIRLVYKNKESDYLAYIEELESYAIMLKNKKGCYADIRDIHSYASYLAFLLGLNKEAKKEIPLDSEHFDTFIPFYQEGESKNVSYRRLKLDVLLDPRFPGGIEYV